MNNYKRRFVPVFRDFPEGCGFSSGNNLNARVCSTQSKFKVHRDFPDFSQIKDSSSNPSETESYRIDGLDNSRDDAKGEQVLESIERFRYHQEKEVVEEREDNENQGLECSVKKRRLNLHGSTMEVVVNTSKRVNVLGHGAYSKRPRQPKNQGLEEGLHNSRDGLKEESFLESKGSGIDNRHKEVIGESKDKQNKGLKCLTKGSSVKNSTMGVGRELANTTKRFVVLGLAATSKCPWTNPKKRGSRHVNSGQEKRRWIL